MPRLQVAIFDSIPSSLAGAGQRPLGEETSCAPVASSGGRWVGLGAWEGGEEGVEESEKQESRRIQPAPNSPFFFKALRINQALKSNYKKKKNHKYPKAAFQEIDRSDLCSRCVAGSPAGQREGPRGGR